jgi:hypothetical protein
MDVVLHRRAEIALRSLPPKDHTQVLASLRRLTAEPLSALTSTGKVRKISGPSKGLYSYRATPRLRLVFSTQSNKYLIEYIADHDHLEKIIRARDEL